MMQVRDRVKELRRVPAADLRKNPRNWRAHGEAQTAALRAMLSEIGFAGALLARELPDGSLELIDGHLRTDLTADATVPVLVLDLTEAESHKLLLTFDPIAAMAEADNAALKSLMDEWKTDNPALQALFDHTAKEYDVLVSSGAPLEEPPAQIDKAAELQKKWGTELGQLWQIGPHQLACADAKSYAPLSQPGQLLLTSPPYGVGMEYEESTPNFDKTCDLVKSVLTAAVDNIQPDGFAFINFGDRFSFPTPMAYIYVTLFRSLGWRWYDFRYWRRQQVNMAIWNTTSPRAMSDMESLYTFQKGKSAYPVYNLEISKSSLWEATGSSSGMGHPAVMATGIALNPIQIYTQPTDLVLDPFCGAGTTLIAAHQLDRVGYGIEIDPGYVAVALERLSLLGLTPKLINGPTA